MEYYTKSGALNKQGREHNRYIEERIGVFQEAIAAVEKCEMTAIDHLQINKKLTEHIRKLNKQKLPTKKVQPGPKLYEVTSLPSAWNVLLVDQNEHITEVSREMRQLFDSVYIGTKKCRMWGHASDAYEIFVVYPQYNIGFSPGMFTVETHVSKVMEFCEYNDFLIPEAFIKKLSEAADAHNQTPEVYLELARRIDHSVYEKCLKENERRKQQ